eukprot:g18399.t1
MSCLMSIEEVNSLTIPKLKAELTKLGQPLAGLKRKADFVEALTAYIQEQQEQQKPTAAAEEAENAPEDAVAPAPAAQPAAEESAADDQSAQEEEPAAPEDPPAVEEAEPMDTDVVAEENSSKAAAAEMPPQQDKPAPATAGPAPASPARTPARASRKRTTRADDEEASSLGKAEASTTATATVTADGDGQDQQQSTKKQLLRASPAAKRKKVAEDAPPERVKAVEENAPPPQQQQEGDKENDKEQAADDDAGNGNAANGNASAAAKEKAAPAADDPMDDEGAAPSSEPGGAAAARKPAEAADAPAGDGGEAGAATDEKGVREEGGGEAAAADPVTIRVDNFVRPFTAPMAKKLLEEKAEAPVLEGGFWMNSIKTHCYATFDGKETAERAMAALQGLQWPPQSFKRLEAKIGDMSAEEARAQDDANRSSSRPFSAKKRPTLGPRVTPDADTKNPAATVSSNGAHAAAGESGATAAAAEAGGGGAGRVRGRGSVQAPGVAGSQGGVLAAMVEAEVGRGRRPAAPVQEVEEEEPIILDDLFRKTDAKPALYWLPLSEEEVGERKKKMEQDGVGPRTTPIPADHIEAVSGGRGGARAGGRGNGEGGWGGGGGGRRGSGGGGPAPFRQGGYGGGDGASAHEKKQQQQDRVEYNCFCFPAGEEEPPVFIPDAKRNKFVVVGFRGASVRKDMSLESEVLRTLRRGSIVTVSEIRNRRAHITKPLDGWASVSTEDGYQIIEPTKRSTKYKVIYEDGVIVRSTASIESGAVTKIATPGSILKATGKTQILDGIERVQIDSGWVSMRLREDHGLGVRLLAPLN